MLTAKHQRDYSDSNKLKNIQFSFFLDNEFIKSLNKLSRTIEGKTKILLDIPKESLQIRKSLIDWLSELKLKLKLHDYTTITAALIYDKVLRTFKHKLNSYDHHLLMISSLLIAIKFEEVEQIDIDSICNHVAHNKFNKKQILACEMLILKRLSFKMPRILFIDFSHSLLEILFKQCFIESNIKYKRVIQEYSLLLFKLTLFDVELMKSDRLTVYICIVFNSFKLFETEPAHQFENFHYQIFDKLDIKKEDYQMIDRNLNELTEKYLINKSKSFIIKEFNNFVETLN